VDGGVIRARALQRQQGAGAAQHGRRGGRARRGLVARERDVQLGVFGQGEGTADGLRELGEGGAGRERGARERRGAAERERRRKKKARAGRAGFCLSPLSSPLPSPLLSPHLAVALDAGLDLEGVGAAIEVDVHDGRGGGAAVRGEGPLPVGELK